MKAKEKNALHLHFLMEDNLSLSKAIRERYERMFSGVFYDRYVLGLWVRAEGLVYPGYDNTVPTKAREYVRYYVSIDYGTSNPCSMGLWGLCDGVWYRIKEFYYSGRDTGLQKTDGEYYDDLVALVDSRPITAIVIDPSAASFIALIRRRGRFRVRPANNDVLNGIRATASTLAARKILINDCCTSAIAEFGAYSWDERTGEDRPIKENDHAMDDIRYFVNTVVVGGGGRFITV